MKLGILFLSFWLIPVSEARLHTQKRELINDAPTRWDDCVGMTGAECEDHILSSLGGNLKNHPIPDLEIKQHPRRPPEVFAKTYWNFGVPTNMFGETSCDSNGGSSVFPWEWPASNGKNYTIPEVPCAGQGALECCDAVIKMMMDQEIPLTDINGYCFSCWVHQQPLRPEKDQGSKELYYVDHSYVGKNCMEIKYTLKEVQANDAYTESSLIEVRQSLYKMLTNPDPQLNCGDVNSLHRSILLHGRALPRAISAASGLFCGQCTSGDNEEKITLTHEQRKTLHFIRNELEVTIRSDRNCIIIYTDHTGDKVLTVPQIGGSLNIDPITAMDMFTTPMDSQECLNPLQPDGQGGCMCPAVEHVAKNKLFWIPSGLKMTAGFGYCECPHTMIEYNELCFCPDGFKIWDPILLTCVCPHGTNEEGSCICPGPFSGLDWNNVGWITNSEGDSCKIDSDCIQSQYNYYSSFEEGCSLCPPGYIAEYETGKCIGD